MVKYIDAHCHLSVPQPHVNVGAVYNAARPSDWSHIVSAINKQFDIYGAIGVHPWHLSDLYDGWDIKLKELLIANPTLLLGEIGLDRHTPNMELQNQIFCNQLFIANELNRGICLHCVGTWDKILNIFKVFQNKLPPFVLAHCYSGPAQEIKRLSEKYNMYFSYGHRNLQDTTRLCATPLNKILAETDSQNPNDIITVVNRIAHILNIAPEKMADIIYKNTIRMLQHGQTA